MSYVRDLVGEKYLDSSDLINIILLRTNHWRAAGMTIENFLKELDEEISNLFLQKKISGDFYSIMLNHLAESRSLYTVGSKSTQCTCCPVHGSK